MPAPEEPLGPADIERHAVPGGVTRTSSAARALAALYFGVVLVAVLWPSGAEVSAFKDGLGPWFLTLRSKDVLLNLIMLAPLTFLATLGWPRAPWWAWAVAGCAIGLGAEFAQWALPDLDRRPSFTNVLQNSAGAWVGAALARMLAAIGTHARITSSARGQHPDVT
ncbi:VanZ family protein [Actinomyces qiguomingii]|uniref:VanZ family protein n=1 Tax=Actinomyces qiguomingii TaxID=2057800 RepID=UPI001E5883C2|nr:VanZ family protein [Actinomyces qiguomingii]